MRRLLLRPHSPSGAAKAGTRSYTGRKNPEGRRRASLPESLTNQRRPSRRDCSLTPAPDGTAPPATAAGDRVLPGLGSGGTEAPSPAAAARPALPRTHLSWSAGDRAAAHAISAGVRTAPPALRAPHQPEVDSEFGARPPFRRKSYPQSGRLRRVSFTAWFRHGVTWLVKLCSRESGAAPVQVRVPRSFGAVRPAESG